MPDKNSVIFAGTGGFQGKSMGISFRLESFEGPLDLLLHLIDKNKMDIYDIQKSTITDQYMDYISRMGKDAEVMSEFLVMAATLLDIKAKMLLPKKEDENGIEEDPRAELVQQLLEYKLYKYMSFELKDKEISASRSFYRSPDIPEEVSGYTAPVDLDFFLKGVDISKLKAVFDDVIKRSREKLNEEAIKFGQIKREPVTLPDRLDYIKKFARKNKKFSFRKLIEKQVTKENIIVTFLAVLELMRTGRLVAVQASNGDDIMMYSPEEAPVSETIYEDDPRVISKVKRIEENRKSENSTEVEN